MELKAGYKRTEVGVIPRDWKLSNLSGLAAFITKGATPTTYGFKWESSGVLFLRSECVGKTGLDLSQSKFISESAHASLRRSVVREGDLLITITGYVGRVVVYRGTEDANINQHIARVRINSPLVCSRLVYHYLSLPQVRSGFNAITTGQAYPQISLKQVRDAEIPFPPTRAEQEAIAKALSDADALIDALEQLAAKKRQLKQGAMQELLTGKKRLPGFGGAWKAKRLGEVCRLIVDGAHFTPRYVEVGIPFYSVENVTANDFTNTKFISAEEHSRLVRRCKPERGDILLARIGSIGDTKLIDWDVEASIYVSLALLKVNNDKIDAGYLYCYSKSRQFVRGMEDRSLMNASPKKINMGDIGDIPVSVPDLSEQTAIAAILSDMDAEIAALEAKLAKARQLKQGMMQELLTGRIRLV